MKQIKVPLTPKEWAEKRLHLLTNNRIILPADADDFLEGCGFYLVEEVKPKTKSQEIPTDKVEAVKYFLNQLPDGYRQRALAQVNKRRVKKRPLALNLSHALFYFTLWDETKEGDDFWIDVERHYLLPEAFPTLPPLPND